MPKAKSARRKPCATGMLCPIRRDELGANMLTRPASIASHPTSVIKPVSAEFFGTPRRGLRSAIEPLLTPVRSMVRARHLTDLAERPLRSLRIRTLFGRGASKGRTPIAMKLHALPERTAMARRGYSAARHGQSDQCTVAWDSRCNRLPFERRARAGRHPPTQASSCTHGTASQADRKRPVAIHRPPVNAQGVSNTHLLVVSATLIAIPDSPNSEARSGC